MCSSLSDECLVKAVLDGDENAFTLLYERYKCTVYSAAYRMIQDSEDARDTTQEVFIKIFRSLHTWDAKKSKLSTWIHRLAANHSIDRCRVRCRRAESQMPEKNEERYFQICAVRQRFQSPYTAVKNLEEIRLVRHCLKDLSDRQRKIFIRRYFQELKLVEIAEVECCNLGTVKTSLHRATSAVRRVLMKSGEIPCFDTL